MLEKVFYVIFLIYFLNNDTLLRIDKGYQGAVAHFGIFVYEIVNFRKFTKIYTCENIYIYSIYFISI